MPPKRTPAKKVPDSAECEDQLGALVHNRGLAQRNVNRILTTLKQAEEEEREPTPAQVKVFQRSVETEKAEFIRLHQEIVAQSPADKRDEQDDPYLQFMHLYEVVSVLLESWNEKLTVPPTQQPPCVTTPQHIIVQSQSFGAPLPTFDGRYEAWPRFKAMFQDLMQRSSDSDAVKLYHLENSLMGDATGVIDLETLQDNDYQRAWDILEQRFGNKRLILESHILGLLNMKKMTKKSSKDLRRLIDECTRHVENLCKLGQPLSGMSELLVVTVLTHALDDQTRELWEASIDQTELPEYEQTIKFLKQRCVILERCEESATTISTSTKVSNQKPPASKFVPSMTSNTALVSSMYVCDFCAGQHQNFKCPVFQKLSVNQRHARVKQLSLCFNCLRKGHRCIACSSNKSCKKCSKRHHTLLHFERRGNPVKRANTRKPSEAIPVCTTLVSSLAGKDFQPVRKLVKNIDHYPPKGRRISSFIQNPEQVYRSQVRPPPSFEGQQQPTTSGIGTAFQRAGVCSRTYAPKKGSSIHSCAINSNHRIGTVTKHRHEARTLTRADGTAATNSERVSAVRSCRECSSEPYRRSRRHRHHHHRLSSSSPCR